MQDNVNLFVPVAFEWNKWYFFRQEKGKFVKTMPEFDSIKKTKSTTTESLSTEENIENQGNLRQELIQTKLIESSVVNKDPELQPTYNTPSYITKYSHSRYRKILLDLYKNNNKEDWKIISELSLSINSEMNQLVKGTLAGYDLKSVIEYNSDLMDFTPKMDFYTENYGKLTQKEKVELFDLLNQPFLYLSRDEYLEKEALKRKVLDTLEKFQYTMESLTEYAKKNFLIV